MGFAKQHRIVIATDGSPSAEAALTVATRMPWDDSAHVLGVVAQPDWTEIAPAEVAKIVSSATADATRKLLGPRWPHAQVVEIAKAPAEAILDAAKRHDASVIVLGWRGHGAFERLLAGSVSRAVASRAPCPVLVARAAPERMRRFMVGYDGTPNAARAIEFLCSLAPRRGHRADILVLGARAASGLKRALLGSVANGALDRAPMPVLLVR